MPDFSLINNDLERYHYIGEVIEPRIRDLIKVVKDSRPIIRNKIPFEVAARMSMEEIPLETRITLINKGLRYYQFTERMHGPEKSTPVKFGIFGFTVESVLSRSELITQTPISLIHELDEMNTFHSSKQLDDFLQSMSYQPSFNLTPKLIILNSVPLVLIASIEN
jgi:hypothetical protein